MLLALTLVLVGCSGGGDDDAPAADGEGAGLRFERVDDEQFHGVGEQGSLVDAAVDADGHAVAVGSVVTGDGDIRPLVVESGDGAEWSAARVADGADGGDGGDGSPTAVTALPDGGFVAIGTRTTSDGLDPALWWRRGDGRWGEPVVPDTMASDGVEDPRTIAAGPAGIMATGLVDGRPTVWTSPDGEEWRVATPRLEPGSAVAAAVVGERFVVLVEDQEAGQLRVLTSDDGAELTDRGTFGQPDEREVHDAAYVEGRYLVVGGRRQPPDGDLNPVAWSSGDGETWTDGADLPHDRELQTNRGAWADSVSAGAGGSAAIASASGHRVWTSPGNRQFNVAAVSIPDSIGLSGVPVVMAAATPTLVGSDRLYGLTGGEWVERSPGVVPSAERWPRASDVTHGPDGFVAVGAESRDDEAEEDGSATTGVVWRSEDGRAWERLADDPDLAGAHLAAVATYEGGYVAVGTGRDGELDRVGRILVSPDGTDWTAVEGEVLEPTGGGVHQLEGVTPVGSGFVATGYGFDGTAIRPLMLVSADGTTVERADVAGPDAGPGPGPGAGSERDLITLGACSADDAVVVVGIDSHGSESYAAVWSSDDAGVSWEQWPSSEEAGSLRDCTAGPDGRILAPAEVGETSRAAVADLRPGAPVVPEELPGVAAAEQEVQALAWLDGAPVVVGAGDDDPGGGAAVWIASDRDRGGWTRLAGGSLGGPGDQHAYGVATDGRTVVVVGTGPEGGAAWTAERRTPGT